MMIIKIIMMYNGGDDLHKMNLNYKMNLNLECITTEKLVTRFDR
jgi:hypothetical protein